VASLHSAQVKLLTINYPVPEWNTYVATGMTSWPTGQAPETNYVDDKNVCGPL
jgi:hypothetical protein